MEDIINNESLIEKLGVYMGFAHLTLSVIWLVSEIIELFKGCAEGYTITYICLAIVWFCGAFIFLIGIKTKNHITVFIFVVMAVLVEIFFTFYFWVFIAIKINGGTPWSFYDIFIPSAIFTLTTLSCIISVGVFVKFYRLSGGYERI